MMNDARILYRRFALATAGLTALTILLRTLSLCFFFDHSVGYVNAGLFPTLLYIALALFVALCAGYAYFASKAEKASLLAVAPGESASTPILRYTSLVCALAFVGATAAELALYGFAGTFPLLRHLAAIAAVLYFALPKQRRFALSGLGAIAYAIATIATEYFDWTVTLNSPIKLMQEAALLSVALFVLVELNHLNHTRRSIRYTVCAALCLFCGLVNGLPLLVASLVGNVAKPDYILHALPSMAVALYAGARLFASHEIELPAPAEESENAPVGDASSDQAPTENPDIPQSPSEEEEQ